MKEEEIKIRITTTLKSEFKKICESEKTTMSNKIFEFINDKVEKEKIKPIRLSLVKQIIEKLLTDLMFEKLTDAKFLLEKTLNNELKFETKVSEIKINNNIVFGYVLFKINDDDDKPYSLNFSIYSNNIII